MLYTYVQGAQKHNWTLQDDSQKWIKLNSENNYNVHTYDQCRDNSERKG